MSEETQETGAAKRPRPSKTLATERLRFEKQLELLRAYGVASGQEAKPVTNRDVSSLVDLKESTSSLANAFFTDTGLLSRGDGGFVPSKEVLAFSQAHQWNEETAPQKLAPKLRASWFGQVLLKKLQLSSLTEAAAIAELATDAGAGKEYERNLRILLDYLEAAALIIRDEGNVKLGAPPSPAPKVEIPPGDANNSADPKNAGVGNRVKTEFQGSGDGGIQFSIDIAVDLKELAGWSPERISAFFNGIAEVMKAKGAMESAASPDR